ncbi:MAG: phosphate/phosphite/phosphonate ABC transporter substrate-binding protein [Nitrospirota bacterium]
MHRTVHASRRFRGFARATAALGMACAVCVGCAQQDPDYRPRILRIGVTPNAPPESLTRQHGPLATYLQRETALKTELVIPKDGDELLAMFHDRRVDMAYLGGYPYLLAHERDRAVPLAMRDADFRSTSLLIVRAESPVRRLEHLRGKRVGLLGATSAAGNLMPRYFLSERGMPPEHFFREIAYADSYDTTARWIRDGRIDAGFVSREAFARLLVEGTLTERDGRVVWETPAYADSVWAVQPRLAPTVQADIQNYLLTLASDDPESRAILEAAGATHFLPAADSDYDAIRRSMDALRTAAAAR